MLSSGDLIGGAVNWISDSLCCEMETLQCGGLET